MRSYASRKLSEELQKAVRARATNSDVAVPARIDGQYRVSPEVAAFVQKMSDYRQRAKTVRVGSY